MVRTRLLRAPAAVFAGVILIMATGCGREEAPVPGPTLRHSAAALSSGLYCRGPDVHTKHLNMFACNVCHTEGGTFGFDNPYVFPGRTTTAGGTLTCPTETSPTTCTVACHYPKGAPAKSIAWDAPGPLACTECHAPTALPPAHPSVSANATRADCEACHLLDNHMEGTVAIVSHGAAWSDPASPQFHAFSANAGLQSCEACHGEDLAGGVSGVACAQCHDVNLPDGVASWKVNCVMCHGGTDNATGAPPKATWGNSGDPVRVGAHTAHAGTAIASAIGCAVCHVTPADAPSDGHVDGGTAEVTFGGIAGAGAPTWDRGSATCAVYCHGATLGAGGTNHAPSWTGGASEAACGSCHGTPPPPPHPVDVRCELCHPDTIDGSGAIIPPSAGGKHLDGLLQAAGGHSATWMDPSSPDFHAYSANAGLAGCQGCHGVNLDGVGGSATTSCATCHGATWRTNCLMCHGGIANTTGAPPSGTWGHETDPLRVGAHTAHVTASTTKLAYDCTACHLKPTDALSAGHVDGQTATVTWGSLATTGGATPSWNRATGTCASTYCHGSYSGTYTYTIWDWGSESLVEVTVPYAGAKGTPSWSATGLTCTACHGSPPANYGWHLGHAGGTSCDLCHPDANAAGTTVTDPSLHVNGVIDVVPRWRASCFNCH